MVSILICTWNRAEQLRHVLADLVTQWTPGDASIEIVVVDNKSTDHTAAVIASFEGKIPVRGVLESTQGLSIARNRAIREASGDWIIFLDDDIRLHPGWLAAYRTAFEDSALFAAGGRVNAVWPDNLPRWVRGSVEPPFYSIVPHHDLGREIIDMTDRDRVPPTANVAFRRVVFDEIGGFREDMGMVGAKRAGGEDTDVMEKVLKRYGFIRYLPDACVDHPVEQSRLSLWWNLKYLHGGGIGQAVSEPPATGHTALGVPVWALKGIINSAVRAAIRFVKGDLRGAAVATGRVAGLSGFVRGSVGRARQ